MKQTARCDRRTYIYINACVCVKRRGGEMEGRPSMTPPPPFSLGHFPLHVICRQSGGGADDRNNQTKGGLHCGEERHKV